MRSIAFERIVAIFLCTAFLAGSVPAEDIRPEIATALTNGDTARAIDMLQSAIEHDPSYHLNYFTLGSIYFEQGRAADAKEQFELTLKRKKKFWTALYYLGLCHLREGNLDAARDAMDKGRKKAKKVGGMFEDGYGEVLMAEEHWQDADRAFRQALVEEPNNATYHIHLGDANFYQGIPSLAIAEYKKALESDTASLEVYFHWAEACLEMKDYNCAIDKLKIVLQKDSTHAPAWMRAGGIYFKAARSTRTRSERTARFKETIGSYKRYLELTNAMPDSSNVRVFFELAMSYVNIFAFEEAGKYFDQVLAIPVEPRDIYFHYGKSLWGTKDFPKAAEMLEKHIEWVSAQGDSYLSSIKDAELYQLLGDCYYYRKPDRDYSKAIDYYKKSLSDRPEQKRVLYNIAVAYHTMKSYAQAIEYYDKRIELGIDSTYAGIYKNSGYCALNIANAGVDDDDIDIDELEEEDGGDATPGFGGIDPNVNYFQLAIDYMLKYMEFAKPDSKIIGMIANTYLYQLSDCGNGISYFEKLLELEPDNCVAKKSLGYAYFGGLCTRNYGRALKYLKGAYRCASKKSGACGDVDLVLWIAQCYHLRAADKIAAKENGGEDFKNAYDWYGKVLKCEPGNDEAKKGQADTRFEF